jgi:exodeoxyribonuclease V alpha subunit
MACLILYLFGKIIFDCLGISLNAFQVGAGLVLMLNGIDMVRSSLPKNRQISESGDPSVVPLAIPTTVGPGTIGTMLVMGASSASRAVEVKCLWLVMISAELFAIVAAGLGVAVMLYFSENLNRLLQSALNPPERGKRELHFRESVFRVGDRVMQTRNNYDIPWESGESLDRVEGNGIFNGDIGTVISVDVADSSMQVRFDDRVATYSSDLLDELEHAWAVTVHKSQGSEYPFVIIPMYGAPPPLLTRNLLYTAVTRARRMVILVGREDIVRTMTQNHRQSMRYTGLAAALAHYLGGK